MINFNTDKIVLVCYPRWAGGKFLINNLGLSNDSLFQDALLSRLQLNDRFSTSKKFDYLMRAISKDKGGLDWNDLGLGCDILLGPIDDDYPTHPDIKSSFLEEVDLISNSERYFFMVIHDPRNLPSVLNVWKNAQLIIFDDSSKFIDNRDILLSNPKRRIQKYWKDVADPSWPKDPPTTIIAYDLLPDRVRDELETVFTGDIFDWILALDHPYYMEKCKQSIGSKSFISWNPSWYLSKQETVDHIEELYRTFDLTPVDSVYLEEYYDAWYNKTMK
jgi:hypothetical protein